MKTFLITVALAASAMAADKLPIVLVLTNHGQLGDTDKATGFYLSEAAHPYAKFTEAEYPVVLASPEGGFAPVDPKSLEMKDEEIKKFWEKYGTEVDGRKGVSDTLTLSKLNPNKVAGVFFAGGHGTMWDFPNADGITAFTTAVDANGGVIGAVCHGPAAFVGVRGADGEFLVKGKKVAVFTNEEEKAVKLESTVPFLLQDAMEKAGAEVKVGTKFEENAIRDGRLITGQNPSSAAKAGALFVEALTE